MPQLNEYKQKREFNKTPEPKGETHQKSDQLIFVIQKHDASHLHYDLRLELNGVLKSWAIPKGPSLNPDEKHLAVMVEDHPFEYKDFEGVIPEGNYGAGTVMIWDKGTFHSAGYEPIRNQSEKELNEGLKKGHISFVLDGKKLKGEFALVKLEKIERENAWLLIKANDYGASKESIIKYDKSAETGRTMDEIKNTSERLWEDSGEIDLQNTSIKEISTYIKPMLATLISFPFNDNNWLFEIKWDGYRTLAVKNGSETNLFTRNHKLINNKFPEILSAIGKISGSFVLDGEIVVVDNTGRPSFNLIQKYEREKNGTLIYYIFDVLYLNNHLVEKLPLFKRKEILSKFLPKLPNVKISEVISSSGIDFFEAAKKQGLEGIIGKNKNSVYEEGMRSKNWVKIKVHQTQEAVIGGFTEPERGRHFFGALLLGVYKDDDLHYIGNVGTGFDDSTIANIKERLQKIIQTDSPFVNLKKNKETIWVRPELVCEIKIQEWTDDSIRQPVFLGLREDKSPQEVVREYPE